MRIERHLTDPNRTVGETEELAAFAFDANEPDAEEAGLAGIVEAPRFWARRSLLALIRHGLAREAFARDLVSIEEKHRAQLAVGQAPRQRRAGHRP